jgi:hypothetical protein
MSASGNVLTRRRRHCEYTFLNYIKGLKTEKKRVFWRKRSNKTFIFLDATIERMTLLSRKLYTEMTTIMLTNQVPNA